MARRDEQQRKIDLLQKLASHRTEIAHHRAELGQQISQKKATWEKTVNVPKRIKTAVTQNPTKWLVGSTIGGLLLTKILFGRRSGRRRGKNINRQQLAKVESRGLLATVALFAAKPLLKSYLINKAKSYVAHKYMGRHQQHPADEYYEV